MEKHYSVRQASDLLGMKVRTVREWIRNGKIVAKKYPGTNHWFIPESEMARLIEHDNEG